MTSGREVVERYPDLAGFARAPGGLLVRGSDEEHARLREPRPTPRVAPERAYVDATAEEVRT